MLDSLGLAKKLKELYDRGSSTLSGGVDALNEVARFANQSPHAGFDPAGGQVIDTVLTKALKSLGMNPNDIEGSKMAMGILGAHVAPPRIGSPNSVGMGLTLKSEENRKLIGDQLVDAMVEKSQALEKAGKNTWTGNRAYPELADEFVKIKYPDYAATSDIDIQRRPWGDLLGNRRGEYSRDLNNVPTPVSFDTVPIHINDVNAPPEFVKTNAHEKFHALDDIRLPKNPNKPSSLRKEGDPLKIPYIPSGLTREELDALPLQYPHLNSEELTALTNSLETIRHKAYREQDTEARAFRAGDTAREALNTVVQDLYDRAGFKQFDLTEPFEGRTGRTYEFLNEHGLLGKVIDYYNTPSMIKTAKQLGRTWNDIANPYEIKKYFTQNPELGFGSIKVREGSDPMHIKQPMEHLWDLVEKKHLEKYGTKGVTPRRP